MTDAPPQLDPAKVQAFVSNAHGEFDAIQSLLSGMLRNPGKTKQLATQASDRIEQILNARS